MISDTEPIEATLFELAVDLNGESTEKEAIDRTVAAVHDALEDTAVTMWRRRDWCKDGSDNGRSTDRSASAPLLICERQMGRPARTPPPDAPLVERCITVEAPIRTGGVAGPRSSAGTHWLPRAELFVSVGSERVLSAGWDHERVAAFDEATVCDVLDRAGAALAAALDRISAQGGRDLPSNPASEIRLDEFRQAIEDAADGVAVLDDETYVYVDQTHVDMYGFDSKQQLLGQSWRALYAADEVARIEAEAFEALDHDGHWQGQVTGSRPDGMTFPAELSLTMVGPSRIVCTVRDVTERETRERELELKERALDEAGTSIQITDPTQPGNPLVYVNEEFVRLTGYERSDALGRNPRFLQGPGSDSETTKRIRTAIETERSITTEVRNYTAAGEPYWAELSVTPVRDENGIVTNYIGVQHDITEHRRLVRELTERTDQLELVLNGTETGIGEWDFSTNTVTLDATFQGTVGSSPTTIDEWQAIVHPEDRERAADALRRPIETGEATAETVRVSTENDEVTWIDIHAACRGVDGGSDRVLAMGRDATTRSERVRWASRLFDQGPLLFVQTRAVDGEAIVETCDRSFCEALGYEAETVVSQPLSEFYDAHSADSLQSDGYNRALSGDLTVTKRTLVTADGDTIPCLLRAIPRTVDGTVVGTDVLFIDISEREKYVRRLEAVFNSPYQLTALLRPSGTVTDVNDALVARSGVDRSAMVGEPFDEFRWLRLDADTELTVSEAVTRAADGTFVRSEAELQGTDGLVRLDVTFKPIRNAAGDITLIAVEGNDITVKTRQRQHLQVLQRVVRHNIRNDLNKLVGWTTILAEEPDPDRRQEHLNRLTRILDGWERITDKMQVIDRAIREIPRDESAADIGTVTETAIATAQDEHPDATIAVSIDAPDVTVSRWVVHPLTEVMKNAVVAGDRADPHVDVSVRREKDGWLQIAVADDGPGMPDIERGALVTGEETALQHGSGVGIWLIRMLISVLGGEVAVDVTDLGTEVTLQIPTVAGTRDAERMPSEQVL